MPEKLALEEEYQKRQKILAAKEGRAEKRKLKLDLINNKKVKRTKKTVKEESTSGDKPEISSGESGLHIFL